MELGPIGICERENVHLIDCRGLTVHEPRGRGSARPGRGSARPPSPCHVGTHPGYIRNLERDWGRVLEILDDVEKWVYAKRHLPPSRPLVLACYCTRGKHRSGAGGGLLAHVLAREEFKRFAVSGVRFMCHRSFPHHNCVVEECTACQHLVSGIKAQVYDHAEVAWNRLVRAGGGG